MYESETEANLAVTNATDYHIQTAVSEVIPIKGVVPVRYYTKNIIPRNGSITEIGFRVETTDKNYQGWFNSSGEFKTGPSWDGNGLTGNLILKDGAKVSSAETVHTISAGATTQIYHWDDLPESKTVLVTVSDGANTRSASACVSVDGQNINWTIGDAYLFTKNSNYLLAERAVGSGNAVVSFFPL